MILMIQQKGARWRTLGGSVAKRHGTTSCMVDKDRFLGIFGGDDFGDAGAAAELYALNCDRAVTLKPMQFARDAALSVYHAQLHAIFVADTRKEKQRRDRADGGHLWSNQRQIECYDVNCGEWRSVAHDVDMQRLSNVFVSRIDPHMLFCVGSEGKAVLLHEFDLRTRRGGVVREWQDALPSNLFRYDLCALYL